MFLGVSCGAAGARTYRIMSLRGFSQHVILMPNMLSLIKRDLYKGKKIRVKDISYLEIDDSIFQQSHYILQIGTD